MRFKDVQRQGKWIKQCKYYVKSVSTPYDSRHGLCQTLEVVDNDGMTETLNYFYVDEQLEIEPEYVGEQWLDVRWKKDSEYFQCVPAETPKDITPMEDSGKPDWNKINFGKCRHGILCAILQSGKPVDSIILGQINRLAKFSMTGELPEN